MEARVTVYYYKYEGRELTVSCRGEKSISKKKRLKVIRELVMNEYGNFDENKLVYQTRKVLKGYIYEEEVNA